MKTKRNNILLNIDWIIILLYVALVFIGWISIYSAVYDDTHENIFSLSQRYGKQIVWISTALIIAVIILLIDSRFFSYTSYFIYAFGIFLLIAVLAFGVEINNSKSWFEIGDFRIQPVEFTKIAVCLAFAQYLSSKNFSFNNTKKVIGLLILFLIPTLLILIQNDTGSAILFFAFIFVFYREGLNKIIFYMSFIAILLFVLSLVFEIKTLFLIIYVITILSFLYRINNKKYKSNFSILSITSIIYAVITIFLYYLLNLTEHITILIILNILAISITILILYIQKRNKLLLITFLLIVGIGAFVYSVDYIFSNILQSHQRERINTLLGKSNDPFGIDYNLNQSKIAIGSGGFYGKGFLRGTQTKYNFVPEQSTDFIFCTIGEEYGFLGTTFVLALFFMLIFRILKKAERQRFAFSRIYGYGIASILFFHVAINIGMTIGLAPVIGIPLPFFSYGGSSLWAFTIMLFIFIKLDADRLNNF